MFKSDSEWLFYKSILRRVMKCTATQDEFSLLEKWIDELDDGEEVNIESSDRKQNHAHAYANAAYQYASKVLNWMNIPEYIIKGFCISKFYAYDYAKLLNGVNVPKYVIDSFIDDPKLAYYYAIKVLKRKNVPPEVIQSFSKDPECSSRYASRI